MMSAKVEAIDHLHLVVPSLERASEVFGALVGGDFWGPFGRYGGEHWNNWAVWYGRGGMEIFEPMRPDRPILGGHAATRFGIIGMAFRVADLDAAVADAEAMGLRMRSRIGSADVGFGKMIEQAQLETADAVGIGLELARRELPDDPLYSAFRHVIDHVEFHVHDLPAAARFLGALTGWSFPEGVHDERLQALSATNGLGIKLTQPTSHASPVARSLAIRGQGVHTMAIATPSLGHGIEMAVAAGLRVVRQWADAVEGAQATLDSVASVGLEVKLIERPGH